MAGNPKSKSRKRAEQVLTNVKAKKRYEQKKEARKRGVLTDSEKYLKNLDKMLDDGGDSTEIAILWRQWEQGKTEIHITEVSKELIIKCIRRVHGIKSFVARLLNISLHEINKMIANDEDIAQAFVDESESILDIAEGRLYEQISVGAPWALQFFLSTKGKVRGYSPKIENSFKIDDSKQTFTIGGKEIVF